MYNITRGNVAPLRATLTFDDEPFMVVNAEDVEVALQSCFKRYAVEDFAIDADAGNIIYIQVPSTLPIGTYGLEVKGTLNNNGWRTFVKCVLDITFATVRGDEEPVTPTSDYYDVTMEVQLYSYAADIGIIRHNEDPLAHPAIRELIPNKDYVLYKGAIWPEEYGIPEDPTSSERKYLLNMGSIVDYIGEKVPWDIVSDPSYVHTDNNFTDAFRDKLSLLPNSNSLNTLLNGKVDKVYGKGLSTNDYTTAEKQKLSTLHNYDDTSIRWLIQNVQDSLVNYYTKSETYSRSQVDALVANIPGMEIVSVDTLPRASASTMNKIYLVPRVEERNNIKDEYITIQEGGNYAWELIGSTDVDLTGYLKDTDVAAVALSGSYNDLDDKPTIPNESTVAGWGFTKNTGTVTGITMNGASKGTSGVVNLGTVVTDVSGKVDKTTTVNGKALSSNVTLSASDVGALPDDTPLFSGDYDDLTNKPTIPVVPTNVSAFNNDAGYLTAHQDISGKEDKVDIVSASGTTLTAEVGKYYTLSSVGTLAIILPTIASGTTKVQTVSFYIAAGSSPAVTWTSTHTIIFADGFQIEANGLYEISAAWNGIGWIIGMLKLVAPSS